MSLPSTPRAARRHRLAPHEFIPRVMGVSPSCIGSPMPRGMGPAPGSLCFAVLAVAVGLELDLEGGDEEGARREGSRTSNASGSICLGLYMYSAVFPVNGGRV